MWLELPEEILGEILKCVVYIAPIHSYFSQSIEQYALTGYGTVKMPSSAALLVSKQWLRIGTPLFFNTVIIQTANQVQRLSQVLKRNPALGVLVRNLRLEGGYDLALVAVVTRMPHIHTLSFNMYVPAKESSAGISRALPLLNPSRLYLHGLERWLANQKTTALQNKLFEAWSTWSSLESVYIQDFAGDNTLEAVLHGLGRVPTLKSISLDSGALEMHLASNALFRSPCLETIVCRDTKMRFASTMERTGVPEDIRERVVCEPTDWMHRLRDIFRRDSGLSNVLSQRNMD